MCVSNTADFKRTYQSYDQAAYRSISIQDILSTFYIYLTTNQRFFTTRNM